MGIAHRLNSLAHDLFTPVAITEADIREELECHVELRTLENLSSGMTPEEARKDAEARFGNFEQNVRECCHAANGIRGWLKHVQFAMVAMLVIAICWLATSMFRMQSRYESELTTLREQLEVHGTAPTPIDGVGDNRMSIKQWKFPITQSSSQHSNEHELKIEMPVSLQQPWSDWKALNLNQTQ